MESPRAATEPGAPQAAPPRTPEGSAEQQPRTTGPAGTAEPAGTSAARRRAGATEVAARTARRASGPYGVLASTVLGVVALAILGAVLGPQWDPVPLSDPVQVQVQDTAIGAAPALRTYAVRTRVVRVELDGRSVDAQISEPVGLDAPAPAVVFVHGAGTGKFTVAFLEQARFLAEHGVVAMVPDKRLDTYSTQHRDYVAMAADYQRSVDVLRRQASVDPDRVGVYAESEGGWIAPVMAAQDQRMGFVVLASSPVVPPREQGAFAMDAYLRNTGVPHGVFRAIPRAIGALGGGFDYADFDVTPWQRQMTQPVLVVYGTGDSSMPTIQGAEQIARDTGSNGNDQVTVRYYAGANHGLRVHGVVDATFLDDLTGWIQGLPATATAAPRIAGAQPAQTYVAAPVPEPRWLRDGMVLLWTIAAAVGAIVLAGLAVPAARVGQRILRRGGTAGDVLQVAGGSEARAPRRFARGIPGYLAAVAGGTIATTVGLVWYLVAIARLALDYERNDWVVTGGWIVVRLLGVAVVVAGVLLLRRVHTVHLAGGQVAPGLLRSVVLWTVGGASAVLLVVLAYWGVYQLGI